MRVDAYNKVSQMYQTTVASKNNVSKKKTSTDKLELSQVGKDCQSAKQIVSDTPDIREDKVNAIKEAIASGTYNVTAEEFAEKILGNYFSTMI